MDDQKCGHVRLYSHDWRGASEHAPCMICERDELRYKLEAALNAEREHLSAFEAQHARATAEFDKRIDAECRLGACQLALANIASYVGLIHREHGSPDGGRGLLVMSDAREHMGEELWKSTTESTVLREVRCGNTNCDAVLSAGEPHVEGCLGSVVETPSFIAKALGGENQVLKHLLKKESE